MGGVFVFLGVYTIRKPERQARVMARNTRVLTREKSADWHEFVGIARVSGVVAIGVGIAWALYIIIR
jgi:preprotein translocase subunit Sss1